MSRLHHVPQSLSLPIRHTGRTFYALKFAEQPTADGSSPTSRLACLHSHLLSWALCSPPRFELAAVPEHLLSEPRLAAAPGSRGAQAGRADGRPWRRSPRSSAPCPMGGGGCDLLWEGLGVLHAAGAGLGGGGKGGGCEVVRTRPSWSVLGNGSKMMLRGEGTGSERANAQLLAGLVLANRLPLLAVEDKYTFVNASTLASLHDARLVLNRPQKAEASAIVPEFERERWAVFAANPGPGGEECDAQHTCTSTWPPRKLFGLSIGLLTNAPPPHTWTAPRCPAGSTALHGRGTLALSNPPSTDSHKTLGTTRTVPQYEKPL